MFPCFQHHSSNISGKRYDSIISIKPSGSPLIVSFSAEFSFFYLELGGNREYPKIPETQTDINP
ncbi:hypothetical protein HanRHA438_Chr09g0410631 [Helianthus annuus]|nr:hypothetical protein HanIR_Chr09g0429721 [Helianthus annuus]KAJ0889229.1 hypothetical protein HanRHA438_Chr09g0410631 [Helianthus annuus]